MTTDDSSEDGIKKALQLEGFNEEFIDFTVNSLHMAHALKRWTNATPEERKEFQNAALHERFKELTEPNAQDTALVAAVHEHLDEAKALLQEVSGHWEEEDLVYRFYHHSYKVYRLQQTTLRIVELFYSVAETATPGRDLNEQFMHIVHEGTRKEFTVAHNRRWLYETRPILEAFFHAKYMLRMLVKYGTELKEPPKMLPSGWASVLYLFDSR